MSQGSTQSYGSAFSPFRPIRGRRRSRSRDLNPSRSSSRSLSPVLYRPVARTRLRRSPLVTKNTVHSFTRMTSSNQRNNLDPSAIPGYWGLCNDSLGGFCYTTNNNPVIVTGPYLNIWFTFLAAHFDSYTNAGALTHHIEYGVPSVAEFAALYQEFRIDWIQVDFYLGSMIGNNQSGAGGGTQVPFINYVKDYNDKDYTTLEQIQQDNSCQTWQPGTNTTEGMCHTIRIRPKAQFVVAGEDGAAGGTAEIPGLQWLSTDTCQNLPHYGIKMAVNNFFPEASPGRVVANLGFNITYHFSFRNTK
mgnify:FL=1